MTLISGHTCGKCKVLEKKLNEADINYTKLWAEEHMDFCREHNIKELPTLVVDNIFYVGLAKCLNYLK